MQRFQTLKMFRLILLWTGCLLAYAIQLGDLTAVGIPPVPSTAPQSLILGKIRHDAWFQPGRPVGSGALRQLRTPRLNIRLSFRRNPLNGSRQAEAPASACPAVTPADTDGLSPCLNPVFHRYYTHSCPVRAGPFRFS
ncbi:MAG: hypothetical protein IJS14_07355 [Lentisphaeria bacterium]|nr:hypothetical protein [Lentisphaeria bacterium]